MCGELNATVARFSDAVPPQHEVGPVARSFFRESSSSYLARIFLLGGVLRPAQIENPVIDIRHGKCSWRFAPSLMCKGATPPMFCAFPPERAWGLVDLITFYIL